jgi:hypothetical protein
MAARREPPIDFVRRHGVVLASAQGPVPSLAEAIAGAPIRGSWWSHPKGHEIFRALREVHDSADVLVCRLVGGKVTFVHRDLWPALVKAAKHFPAARLARVREEHTAKGHHATREVAFPKWVPPEVRAAAAQLTEAEALGRLGPCVAAA